MIKSKTDLFPLHFNHHYFLRILLMAILYFVSGHISFAISQDESIITIVIFAAEGFALAATLLFGRSMWLGVLIGQFVLALSIGMEPLPSFIIATINAMEAVLGVILFYRFNLHKELTSIRDVVGLVLLIILVLQPFSALLGTLTLVLFTTLPWQEYFYASFSWWFGNSMGQLLLTPLLLLFCYHKKSLNIKELLLVSFSSIGLYFLLHQILGIEHIALLMMTTLLMTLLLAIYRGTYYALFATLNLSIIALYLTHITQHQHTIQVGINSLIDLNFYILAHIILVLIIGTLFEVNERIKKQLHSIANYDYLTGIPNRHLLDESISNAMQYTDVTNHPSVVCFLDLDGFKEVNDRLGHGAGDDVLKEIVIRIQALIRQKDLLIRLGGDEFVLILTGITSETAITALLERILNAVRQPIGIGEQLVGVSLSIGVARYPKDGHSVEVLIEHADQAMYRAKKEGKDRFVFFEALQDADTKIIKKQ